MQRKKLLFFLITISYHYLFFLCHVIYYFFSIFVITNDLKNNKTMKNQITQKGKKLNKKELNMIKGGLRICIPPGTTDCAYFGKFCGEPECKIPPVILP
ncbi:hypothetical protein DRF67_01075 [Chryseobacterium pennipullorum]|uniref:Bacteriocin-type signal sequence-containing protein n=2 Tax=Chryseobacterium pennipullorum TaxID=2258963 RepID=A0A3D9BA28_9FLAO|nr:hypothetical protein DRF67_01075 [Chryseobacterium pennipullorum]